VPFAERKINTPGDFVDLSFWARPSVRGRRIASGSYYSPPFVDSLHAYGPRERKRPVAHHRGGAHRGRNHI
jgi:hypothetical protein